MKATLGLANGNIPPEPEEFTDELIDGWLEAGIRSLAVNFAGRHEFIASEGGELRARLADRGLSFVQYSGVNANFVHPDPAVRKRARESVKRGIDAALALGSPMIVSGSGTTSDLFEQFFYHPAAENYSPASEERLVEGLRGIASDIEAAGLQYAIECHQLTTMRTPEIIRRVLDAVNSPAIAANFDPVNLLDSAHAAYTNRDLIPRMVEIVGERYAPTTHVKDLMVTTDFVCSLIETTPGAGVIDFATVFRSAASIPAPRTMALIVEHLPPARAKEGLRHIREIGTMSGVDWQL